MSPKFCCILLFFLYLNRRVNKDDDDDDDDDANKEHFISPKIDIPVLPNETRLEFCLTRVSPMKLMYAQHVHTQQSRSNKSVGIPFNAYISNEICARMQVHNSSEL